MTTRMRYTPPPVRLKTIALSLREDEVRLLTKVAEDRGITRQQLLRSILRGAPGVFNPLPPFFEAVIAKETGPEERWR